MTEKVKKEKQNEVTLKPEDKKLLHSTIEALKGHKHETPNPTPKPHWKADDLLKDAESCPTCKVELKALTLAGIADLRKERETKPFECENCGLGVDEGEKDCVLCGGVNAKAK